MKIDRKKLIAQYNPNLADIDPSSPLTVGNGEFAFTADVTGLQSLYEDYKKDCPLCRPTDQSSLNYFASAWAAVENILLAATAEGLSCAFRIPIGNEPEHVKRLVGAPEEYEFTCFLAVGYAAENAHVCRQKEIRTADRIHRNVW